MNRDKLPHRRANLTFGFTYPPDQAAAGKNYAATVGFYDDGRLGEIFLKTGKSETQLESMARDMAVVTSIALQYGAPQHVIEGALTKLSDGRPAGPLGVLFHELKCQQ